MNRNQDKNIRIYLRKVYAGLVIFISLTTGYGPVYSLKGEVYIINGAVQLGSTF